MGIQVFKRNLLNCLLQVDVFVAMDYHKRSYGNFHGRIHLQGSSPTDASLVITEITLEDYGKYKCEVIDGLEDSTVVVTLDLEGELLTFQISFCLKRNCPLNVTEL